MPYFKNHFPKSKQQKLRESISNIQNEAIADSKSIGNSAKVRQNIRNARLEKVKTDLQFTPDNWFKKLLLKPNGWVTGLVFFIFGLLGDKEKLF